MSMMIVVSLGKFEKLSDDADFKLLPDIRSVVRDSRPTHISPLIVLRLLSPRSKKVKFS